MVKYREAKTNPEKITVASGTLIAMLYSFCMCLNFIHYGHIELLWLRIWLFTLALTLLVFVPAYLAQGMGKPQTRLNTLAVSVLIVAVTSIHFALTNLHPRIMDREKPQAFQEKHIGAANVSPGQKDSNTLVLLKYKADNHQ